MVEQLRGKDKIKRTRWKRRRQPIGPDNRNRRAPKISLFSPLDSHFRGNDGGGEPLQKGDERGICLLHQSRREMGDYRLRFKADYFSADALAPCPTRDGRRDITTSGADVEQTEAIDFLFLDEPLQTAEDAPIPAKITIDNPQIAEIFLQDLLGLTRQIHQLFIIPSLHSALPRAMTNAEFFEPKPMQLHSATSTGLDIA